MVVAFARHCSQSILPTVAAQRGSSGLGRLLCSYIAQESPQSDTKHQRYLPREVARTGMAAGAKADATAAPATSSR